MNAIIVIQADYNSTGPEGSILQPLCGIPVLWYTIESIRQLNSSFRIIVSTSKEKTNDPVADLCAELNIECSRNTLEDAGSGFFNIAKFTACDAMVRIKGNSPLIDHRLVTKAIKQFSSYRPDLITNQFPETFPSGQSVEVINASSYANLYPRLMDPLDLNGVTTAFYNKPESYRILNFTFTPPLSRLQLGVESEADLKRITAIIKGMNKSHWEYNLDEIIKLHNNSAA